MSHEEWRPVVRWEGVYEVSSLGRVRRVNPGKGSSRDGVLFGTRLPSGHIAVTLRDSPRYERTMLHRLVLEAFVGPCPEGMEACHFPDRDPSNNRLSNLRWGTRSENRFDAVKHGTHFSTQKTRCPRGHLLELPNLDPHRWAKGHRICLSCNVERKRAWRKGEEFAQELADQHYDQIMQDDLSTDQAAA